VTDLRGRIAIVTGGYSGVGLETTPRAGWVGLIVPARSAEKARTATPGVPGVEPEPLKWWIRGRSTPISRIDS